MTTTLYDQLINWFKSPEGKAEIARRKEENKQLTKIVNSQLKRFHNLSVKERTDFVKKVIKKYDSIEYKTRWYDKYIFPPCELFTFFFEYAKKYGVRQEDHDAIFADSYTFDSKWSVNLLYGQGTAVIISEIEE